MIFSLRVDLDLADIAARLAANGRVQIPDFLLREDALALLDHLRSAANWTHVLNAGDKVYEIAAKAVESFGASERAELDRKVDKSAAEGFQFRFDTIRVPDSERERMATRNPLSDFARFLSAPPCIDWFRAVTGRAGIDFADCQATRYTSGAFLTRHDDDVAGKHRHFAYVLGLTKEWRDEWGGLLLFPQKGALTVEALLPRFNTLTLFEVGQDHSVSQVATYAPVPRYSVTGWLRSRPQASSGA